MTVDINLVIQADIITVFSLNVEIIKYIIKNYVHLIINKIVYKRIIFQKTCLYSNKSSE